MNQTSFVIHRREPLYIENGQETYVLREGGLHLFLVGLAGGGYGRRHYLKSLQPGSVFFGGRIQVDGRDFVVAAVPGQAAARIETTGEEFAAQSPDQRRRQLAAYAREYLAAEQKARDLSRLKAKKEAGVTDAAMREFLKINALGAGEEIADTSADPLYQAAALVCRFDRIRLLPPEELSAGGEEIADIDSLARAARLNIREVLLEADWRRRDNGALLAYLEEDGRPVALIPQRPGQYVLHDVARGTCRKLSQREAAELKPQAVMFYRPFPHKKLNLPDILKQGVQNTWKRDSVIIGLMALIGALIGLLVPKVTQIMIDDYIPSGEKEQLWHIGLLMIAFLIGKSLFQLTRDLSMLRIEGKMEGSLQTAVWERLLSLPTSFFKDYTSGELAMRAFGISQIRQMISGVFVSTLITGVFSLVYLFQVHAYGGELLKPAVVMLLILLVFGYVFGRIQTKTEKEYLTLTNRISGLVLQLFNAIAKFRVAGAENRAFKQWADLFTHSRRLNFRKEIITIILNTVLAIAPLVFSLVFYIKAVKMGMDLQVGEFVAFTTAFGALSEGMMGIIRTIIQINAVKPMYELSKPILEALPEYDEQKVSPGRLQGHIRVSHLNFRYDAESPPVLQDISLEIQKGEYVALVGPSGCGKSTLFRLLLGFETPEGGQVYYDDKDIGLVDVKSVRRQLGVVLQNGQLMSGDIFTNIIGANTKLTMEDAKQAAEMAGLTEDIERMPMGMHTVVAEGAGTLSGGQKQRILIARAIVHQPAILYLDEATSALDNKTQKKVSDSLSGLDCTRVVIAQRLSTVVNCDRIIVMESGRIVETGSYQELMEKQGLFADLAQRQLA